MTSRSSRCPTCHRLHKRSHPQNSRYWALVHLIAERLTPQGQRYSAEQWHTYFKSRYLGADDVRLPNGKVHVQVKSSADLDVAEFNTFMEQVEAWAAEHDVWLADLAAA